MNKQTTQKRRAVIYLRTAQAKAPDDAAIARQRTACEELAQELGVEVVKVYADMGGSGVSAERPGLKHMLADLKERRHASYVLSLDTARISRNMALLQKIIGRLHACGVQVRTTRDSAFREVMETLFQVFAQLASEEHSQAIKAGIARRRLRQPSKTEKEASQ